MRLHTAPVVVAVAACILALTNSILAARARALLQPPPAGQEAPLTAALKSVSDTMRQAAGATLAAGGAPASSSATPPFEYATAAPSAVAYAPDGTPYLVIPAGSADVAGAGQQPATSAAAPGQAPTEPRVEAAGGAGLLLKHLATPTAQAPAPATAQPSVLVVPAATQPTQLAAAATPAPTQAAGPFTPTTVGSGGIRVVTSNPISISNPIKNVNPTVVKSLPSVLGLLGGATSLLGGLFGGGKP